MEWTKITPDATNYDENINYIEVYWDFHPRYNFIKTLPDNASMLDLGAGPGNLFWWKKRGILDRSDLRFFAIDLKESPQFSKYEGFKIYDLEETRKIDYPDSFFDAAFCSHVLEHLHSMKLIIEDLHRTLKTGGLVYIEIPTPLTLNYPRKEEILKDPFMREIFDEFISHGEIETIQASLLSFWDDKTHHKTYSHDEMIDILKSKNFYVINSGVITNPYIENKLITYGIKHKEAMAVLMGLWLKYKFSQFFVCKKI